MSFSSNSKHSLLEEMPTRTCCKKALLMGILTYSSVFSREKIKYVTEIKPAAEAVISLLDELYGIKSNLYVTERKNSREDTESKEAVNSYKITVAGKKEISKMSADLKKNSVSLYRVNSEIFDKKCGRCASYFMRGAFIASGTVSRPQSSFHLEISTPFKNLASDTVELCREAGFSPRTALRNSSNVIYFKKCDDIADFLAFIGANTASFDYINESIVRESRGLANRAVNCDTANIKKTVNAATETMTAIKYLKDNDLMEKLPPDLKKTAELRYENPQASLVELAEMSAQKLTKSGVNHRLKKIIEIYEKYKRGTTN